MAAPEVEAFAKYLAGITESDERARAFALARNLAANTAPPEAFEPPIRTLGQYLDDPIEVPPELVYPYQVVRGGLNAIIGRSGKGKTVMSLNRILRWSAGKPLFDMPADEEGKIPLQPCDALRCLIIENEGAAGMFHRQIGIMLNADGYLTEDDRKLAKENILIWGDGGYSDLKVDDPNKWNAVRAGVEKHKPDIVFLEPFRSLWKGEENSSTEMSRVVDAMVSLAAEYECGVQVAHHEKKGGSGEDDKMSAARGSTVLENFVTVMENFEGVKGGDYRELSWSKSRHANAPNPIRMEWDPGSWWYKWVASTEIEEDIISAVRNSDGPMKTADLAEVTGEKVERLRTTLKRMTDDKRLIRMSSESGPGGSTGFRYALPLDEDAAANGGFSV